MSDTFYLKYRPQKIADLDLADIRQQLTEVLSSSQTPHAWLFSGPKGTGKTSSARIVAKAVNCLKRAKGQAEPCNRCSNCQLINQGQALDLFEIDAASNRGIDDIRSLKERIKLTPSDLKFKVYIIDEVHMLTTEAFNALLKTLEEPPAHALFILCTTEPHKLPATVVSRCLRLKFRRASDQEMARALKRVVKAEKLKLKDEVLALISQQSDGSFRDGVKLLEQLSFKSKVISLKRAQTLLGQGQEQEWLKYLQARQLEPALQWLSQAVEQGIDLVNFGRTVLELLRQSWLAKYGLGQGQDLGFSEPELKALIELLAPAVLGVKTAVIPQLPLELAVVDWCQSLKPSQPPAQTKASTSDQTVEAKWPEILHLLKPKNHSLEALLKAARPLGIEEGKLVIEVFYPFHKGQLETPRCLSLVEEAVTKVLAKPLRVCYTLTKRTKGAEDIFK